MAEMLRHLGLFDCFDAIVGATTYSAINRSRIPLTLCELIGVPPEKCVVFEDAELAFRRRKCRYGCGRRPHAVSSTPAVISLFGSSFSATLLPVIQKSFWSPC